jgi:MFS transporter, FHS family, L-fucose permease
MQIAKPLPLSGSTKTAYVKQISTIGAFFFIFGFITWVNGTLIPYFRIACELQEWEAYLVTFAFYISYTVMAIPSSKLLQVTGMVNGMRIGLVVMAVGCALFVPAALMRYYPIFLAGLFVVGAGTTLLQTAVNPYITLLGPPESAAQRISIMGICNKFAGILAPLILGAIILKNSDGLIQELAQMSSTKRTLRLNELAKTVIVPYCVLTVLLLLIAFILKYAHLPDIKPTVTATTNAEPVVKSKTSNHNLAFFMGFSAIFCAVGVEVIAGDTIGNYGIYHGMSLDVAKSLTSYTLAGMLAGYMFGAFGIPRIISQEKGYLYSSIMGIVFTILAIVVPGKASIAFIALLGFANALLWPAIWPLALRGLIGKQLNRGSAILIMGIAGGALLPLLYGWLSQNFNNQVSYWILIPCYLFNVYYAVSKSEKGKLKLG